MDIAGEIPEFQLVHSYAQRTKSKYFITFKCIFWVIPTYLATSLSKENLLEATCFNITYSTIGEVSKRMIKTVLKDTNKEDVIRISKTYLQKNNFQVSKQEL